MRFIHTADWHIGKGRSYLPDALARTLSVIDRIYRVAVEEQIDTVVVAGDIFDSPNVEDTERRALYSKIAAYDAAGIATLMISGNHDRMTSATTTLDYLEAVTDAGAWQAGTVVTQRTRLVIRNGYGFLLFDDAWDRFAPLLAIVQTGSIRHALKGLIVVAHQTIRDTMAANGTTMLSGIRFEPDRHVDYYAFGDIHKCQRVRRGAWYSGAPLQTDFGEDGETGVLIVDTDEPEKPVFRSIPSVRLRTIGVDESIPENAIVRIRYDDKPILDPGVLPSNVVKFTWTQTEIDLSNLRSSAGLLSGLDDVLQRRGLNEDDVTYAMSFVQDAIIQVGESPTL